MDRGYRPGKFSGREPDQWCKGSRFDSRSSRVFCFSVYLPPIPTTLSCCSGNSFTQFSWVIWSMSYCQRYVSFPVQMFWGIMFSSSVCWIIHPCLCCVLINEGNCSFSYVVRLCNVNLNSFQKDTLISRSKVFLKKITTLCNNFFWWFWCNLNGLCLIDRQGSESYALYVVCKFS